MQKLVGVFTVRSAVLQNIWSIQNVVYALSMHNASVCVWDFSFHAHTETDMSDKTATVCPACQLYLNVCVQAPNGQAGVFGSLPTSASAWRVSSIWNYTQSPSLIKWKTLIKFLQRACFITDFMTRHKKTNLEYFTGNGAQKSRIRAQLSSLSATRKLLTATQTEE